MTPELEQLCERLERGRWNYVTNEYCGRPINPDGPEAAATIRRLAGALEYVAGTARSLAPARLVADEALNHRENNDG